MLVHDRPRRKGLRRAFVDESGWWLGRGQGEWIVAGRGAAVAVTAAGIALAAYAARQLARAGGGDGEGPHAEGWKSVTVEASPEQVATGGDLPRPLAEIGDAVEVRMLPAPGDRGTEVHARLIPDADLPRVFGDRDPEEGLRVALREAKQLVETGEILRVIPRPHGRRPDTPAGRLVDAVEKSSKGKGIL
jgi:hypothetical protein